MQRCMGCMKEFGKEYDVCPYCGYITDTLPENPNYLVPGTIIAQRYILGRVLGYGGFGVTYLSWDSRLNRAVAVKEFLPNSVSTRSRDKKTVVCINSKLDKVFRDGVRKMLDEGMRISKFSHIRNIVDIHDCFEENDTAYIVMEYLDGMDLKEYLAENGGRLEPEEALKLIMPVLNALEAMHSEKLIHRDIAPDNIFLCKNGEVKLLDFGSARLAVEDSTKSLSVMVKRGFAPREQYASRAKQGSWTDVYAVCATLYCLITGETPPDSMERDDEQLKTFAQFDISGFDELEKVIHRGMALNYEDRIQSVSELRKQLINCPPIKPVKKHEPEPFLEKTEKSSFIPPQLNEIEADEIDNYVRQLFYEEIDLEDEDEEPEIYEPISPKKKRLIIGLVVAFVAVIGVAAFVFAIFKNSYTLDENGVLTIKNSFAMHNYDKGEAPWYDQRDQITSVVISDRVTKIGKKAFRGCNNLTSVTIPDSITTIGDSAFSECYNLTNVTIGNNVITIGDNAFFSCGLTRITIPDSVTTIGECAFESCDRLTNVTIPDSVITIGNYAFCSCDSIKNVAIPDSVTTIGNSAFFSCYSLLNITIPDSVTSIGDSAFYECTSLKSVTIGNGVKTIGDSAFGECYNLTNVTIPDSVTSIGDKAFSDCDNLTSITIPDSVTTIGKFTFHKCDSLTSIKVGNSVTAIGDSAFYECTSLTSVTIPDSVTTIGDHAFSGCSSLASITIGNNVTTIGDYAFCYCTSLESVTIPDSVTTIGDDAFGYVTFKNVYYTGSESEWAEIEFGYNNGDLIGADIHYNS